MKRKYKIIIAALLAAVFLNAAGFFIKETYFTCGPKSGASSGQPGRTVFVIEKGQGFREVGSNLREAGLIDSRFWFDVFVLASGRRAKLQAGVYELSSDNTIAKIVKKISKGGVLEEKITILEGWNIHDIANYLQQKQIFSQDDFLTAAQEDGEELQDVFNSDSFLSFDFSKGNGRVAGLEGFLFPDTYEFAFGSSISDVLREILANFKVKIDDDLRSEIKKQGKSLYDVLIMASLLEKEVKTYEDKQVVAGILWKRLENDWPLQVDATINYALGKPGARLSLDDLQFNSPYNTYRNKGLPPGPICNPGLESIEAAVYYKETSYWYYLSASGGKTIFSQTFDQHKAAKAKYLN
ncbi:MAG: endolytic transglycosylase MltG [Candidatus Pacebacteria bacterium]|nr:endolytic transglycosylase MltG [Candidatus Paceibacterota bacterium]